jgi:site-specific DNA-cytosine methylase
MKILELFAGSRSIGKAAEELGHEVFSTDIHPFEGIDLVKDVLEINTGDIPFVPDVIWASPPCTGFSVAAIGHHWTGGKGAYIPKTDTARLGIKLGRQDH